MKFDPNMTIYVDYGKGFRFSKQESNEDERKPPPQKLVNGNEDKEDDMTGLIPIEDVEDSQQ